MSRAESDDEEQTRLTLFDSLQRDKQRNLYCSLDVLGNESSVETFFVNRMLKDLGYQDRQIQTKKSISELVVSLGGSKTVRYKPDYVLTHRKVPRWVLDAKATDEPLEKWIPQCSGYCLALNQKYGSENPVELFMLTNGLLTRVHKWDVETPLLELSFSDFQLGNPKYERLKSFLSASFLRRGKIAIAQEDFVFRRPTAELAKRVFSQCHRVIWKSEGINPTAAFMEFTKLMFVKLWADRQLRNDPRVKELLKNKTVKLPKSIITFSNHWIEANETVSLSPINDILFKTLRDEIEKDIVFRKKKRIFSRNEIIKMGPDTIKAVVKRLEHYDMYGIDDDLNGRLFETFLSATMRGAQLGQYFTPRSVVKLIVRMANLKAEREIIDNVIDACCGTGGFLVEALHDMREKVKNNKSLSATEKEKLLNTIANDSIYGIDFGKDPPIARIARINMYLHGDGGSRMYYADALDKSLAPIKGVDPEVLQNQTELKKTLENGLIFKVALTNPPFAMTKELSNETEATILKQYDLAKMEPETSRYRPSLRSSIMFIERYRDLLVPSGRLFTVINDTILASKQFSFVRNFIRKNFIVRGIVSLPGDAFRRAGSRVKTSILCLEKKVKKLDTQPHVFVAFSEHLGVDDLTPRASAHTVAQARKKAEAEIDKISTDFVKFLSGDETVEMVSPERIKDRFDLKFVVPLRGRYVSKWKKMGLEIRQLTDVVEVVEDEICPQDSPKREFVLIKITYDGICEIVEKKVGKLIKPSIMHKVHTGDLIFSKIRATDGAVGIVPPELNGALVSKSFVVLRCPSQVDTVYVWAILRSHEIRADLMSVSTGTGRYTTDWLDARHIKIPWMEKGDRTKIAQGFIESWKLERKIAKLEDLSLKIVDRLGVESEESKKRFRANKPPK